MKLRIGYELTYDLPQPTPMILLVNVHHSRVSDLSSPDHVIVKPFVAVSGYRDAFGNWCTRLIAPTGTMTLTTDAIVNDSGIPDAVVPHAQQVAIEDLPEDALVFLLASRFCDSDRMLDLAWSLFGGVSPGWTRVQSICDFGHRHVAFGYQHASVSRTASEAYREGQGVCRDYAHLAIAFCKCLNIPARYCTGYLGDVGTAPPYGPGDFAAWFEAYLDGRWHTFDPRNNTPRVGRILIARGRDAADVAITTTFGSNKLTRFRVWTDEITTPHEELLGGNLSEHV